MLPLTIILLAFLAGRFFGEWLAKRNMERAVLSESDIREFNVEAKSARKNNRTHILTISVGGQRALIVFASRDIFNIAHNMDAKAMLCAVLDTRKEERRLATDKAADEFLASLPGKLSTKE